jgi:hypothetical protein
LGVENGGACDAYEVLDCGSHLLEAILAEKRHHVPFHHLRLRSANSLTLGSGNALIWEEVIRIQTVTTRSAFHERSLRASSEHGECYELTKQRRVKKRSEDGGRNERVASQRSGAALAGVTNTDG